MATGEKFRLGCTLRAFLNEVYSIWKRTLYAPLFHAGYVFYVCMQKNVGNMPEMTYGVCNEENAVMQNEKNFSGIPYPKDFFEGAW